MSDLLRAYSSISSSSARADLSSVLQSIIGASPTTFDPASRKELIQSLLDDLKACSQTSTKTRLTPQDAAQALLAVKTLGKHPSGSEVIASPTNLSTLLALSAAFKDQPDASGEALRCVANALLLIEEARVTWIDKDKDVGGRHASVELLEKSTTPDQIFLASRILFLCTASAAYAAPYIRWLVETKHHGHSGTIVDIIAAKLDTLIIGILTGAKMSREAMSDLLKFAFNLLVHYPKLVDSETHGTKGKHKEPAKEPEDENKLLGDVWSHRLDGILPPLLRVFTSLPPTFPAPIATPLTHVIHSLILIPVTPSLRSAWFGYPKSSSSGRSSASTNSPSGRKPQTGSSSSSRSHSPPTLSSSKEPKPGALDRALSVLSAGRRSLSRTPSPSSAPDVLLRISDLLDVSLAHYLPDAIDPDDPAVRALCRDEADDTLDDLLSPLVLLLTRLCIADDSARLRIRELLLPVDLDRTHHLEDRTDTLGRCLRLLRSVYHPRLQIAAGELLFAICDSDAATLSSQVGYGNVAGFLFNKGIMSAPAPPASSSASASSSGPAIDPITGTLDLPKPPMPEMTDEEKDIEAEKLFVLFDRLEKSGALPPNQNPVRKAIAQQNKQG